MRFDNHWPLPCTKPIQLCAFALLHAFLHNP
jgi:hypothetical protein